MVGEHISDPEPDIAYHGWQGDMSLAFWDMKREDLYNALVAVTNEATGEKTFSPKEARSIVEKISDAHIEHISKNYESPEEWAEYFSM